jgi:hypothetical protein
VLNDVNALTCPAFFLSVSFVDLVGLFLAFLITECQMHFHFRLYRACLTWPFNVEVKGARWGSPQIILSGAGAVYDIISTQSPLVIIRRSEGGAIRSEEFRV